MSNQRHHFRLEYPAVDRPTIQVQGTLYPVLDLSEQGVKFRVPKVFKAPPNHEIKATINFRDGKQIDVAGKVLRILERRDENHCVMALTTGIPLPKMIEEQRHLLKKYRAGD